MKRFNSKILTKSRNYLRQEYSLIIATCNSKGFFNQQQELSIQNNNNKRSLSSIPHG